MTQSSVIREDALRKLPALLKKHDKNDYYFIIVVSPPTLAMRKRKFVISRTASCADVIYTVRKHIVDLKAEDAIFVITDRNEMLSGGNILSNILREDSDGLVTLTVHKESVFGGSDNGEITPFTPQPASTATVNHKDTDIEIINFNIIKSLPPGLSYYYCSAQYHIEIQYTINDQYNIIKQSLDMNRNENLIFTVCDIIKQREKLLRCQFNFRSIKF